MSGLCWRTSAVGQYNDQFRQVLNFYLIELVGNVKYLLAGIVVLSQCRCKIFSCGIVKCTGFRLIIMILKPFAKNALRYQILMKNTVHMEVQQ